MNDDKEPHSDSSESKEEKKDEKITGDKNQKTSTLLPLARVKRIIKSDPDVKLISSDACFLVAKATVTIKIIFYLSRHLTYWTVRNYLWII